MTDARSAIISQQRAINHGLVDLCHAQVDLLQRLGDGIAALPGGPAFKTIMDAAFADMTLQLRTLIEQQKIVEAHTGILATDAAAAMMADAAKRDRKGHQQ